jgi:hypothetical protein
VTIIVALLAIVTCGRSFDTTPCTWGFLLLWLGGAIASTRVVRHG